MGVRIGQFFILLATYYNLLEQNALGNMGKPDFWQSFFLDVNLTWAIAMLPIGKHARWESWILARLASWRKDNGTTIDRPDFDLRQRDEQSGNVATR